MHRRFYAHAAALTVVALAAGGCAQMTRHSNTMVFGTNTSFGVKAGTDATQVPSVSVGFSRQEIVIMPLVANTANSPADQNNDESLLNPCDLTKPTTVNGGQFAVHPCSLVALNGKALDSYSVLASFGATYDVNGSGAKGGLAQYFATGIAAQLLAATGGASVVATGEAAKASAEKAPLAGQTIAALYGDDPAFQLGVADANSYEKFLETLLAKITLTDVGQLKAKVTAFETASGSLIKIADACTDKDVCKARAKDAYAVGYSQDKAKFETALSAW